MTHGALKRLVVAVVGLAFALSAVAEETPFTELPYTPSLDLSAMDREVDACEDLVWSKNSGGACQRPPQG